VEERVGALGGEDLREASLGGRLREVDVVGARLLAGGRGRLGVRGRSAGPPERRPGRISWGARLH